MKKIVGPLIVLLVLVGGGIFAWRFIRSSRIDSFASEAHPIPAKTTVEIPPGSGPKKVAGLLAEAGVVSDADMLYEYLRQENLGPKLKAGEYEFEGSVSPKQAIDKIVSGEVKTYRFTVPEGLRSDEIFPILAASDLKLDAEKLQSLSTDPRFLQKVGIPADRIEGFLYPDTYTFARGATEEQVLTKMVGRALEEYRAADAQRAPGVSLKLLETFTLASIVEKETGAAEERPRISCVFHNRLRLGMKLQTDPTVLYAMSLIRGSWVNNITKKDLETPHPYNTYTTKGLPPGPIANPGSAALKAALNPIRCDDLFFVSQNNGTHVFCPDLRCHNAAVAKWQQRYFAQGNGDTEAAAASGQKPAASSSSHHAATKKKKATKRHHR